MKMDLDLDRAIIVRAIAILLLGVILPLSCSVMTVSFVYCARKVEREIGSTDAFYLHHRSR